MRVDVLMSLNYDVIHPANVPCDTRQSPEQPIHSTPVHTLPSEREHDPERDWVLSVNASSVGGLRQEAEEFILSSRIIWGMLKSFSRIFDLLSHFLCVFYDWKIGQLFSRTPGWEPSQIICPRSECFDTELYLQRPSLIQYVCVPLTQPAQSEHLLKPNKQFRYVWQLKIRWEISGRDTSPQQRVKSSLLQSIWRY